MDLFLDTSALVALLDSDEAAHAPVVAAWRQALTEGVHLITSNYVELEAVAVLQRRFGLTAVRALLDDLLPLAERHFVDATLHTTALRALRLANRRDLSLVDCTSFELMRDLGISRVLTLDSHFGEQGFTQLPALGMVHEG